MILVVGGIALALAGRWLITRGPRSVPLLRTRGVNLEATRGATPAVWLCAHLDTKSQRVPTLLRVIGTALQATGYVLMTGIAVATAIGYATPGVLWAFTAVVTLAGAVIVVQNMTGHRSPGALDNASGVVTVIEAVRELKTDRVGVLITDAEEMGLAGAQAWVDGRRRAGIVLNCDGVDDGGVNVIMHSGARPQRILQAARDATRSTSIEYEVMRMIPGVITDSVAFTAAGLESVTFSRGTWWSLARVHSMRDDLAHLTGAGIAPTARQMAAVTQALLQEDSR